MNIGRRLLKVARPVLEQLPTVVSTYRYYRDNKRIQQEPKETPMGFKLIGNPAMEQGTFEPQETKIVNRIFQKVDVFVNVGANIGYYCCLAQKLGKYTVAFEPIGLNLQFLYRNIKANNWGNTIEIFPIALSDNVGILEIYGGGTGASLIKGWAGISEQYVTFVPTSTMDHILGCRFKSKSLFILVNIEGAEKPMLKGATSILGRDPKPIWMVEICISEHQPKGIKVNPNLFSTFEIFLNNGYEAFSADYRFHQVSLEELEAIIKSGNDTLMTHNFLFIESGRKEDILEA